MRIGVDATCWVNGRGYGRFTRELLRAMVSASPGDEFVCFVDAAATGRVDLRGPNVRFVPVTLDESPTTAAAADGSRTPRDLLRMTRAVWQEPMDVFFSPSVYTYFPLPPRLAAVVTVHDAIAERFPELTLPSRRARLFWRLKVRLALWQAKLVLTVSHFAAREIAEVLHIAPRRIRVAGEAPAPAYRPSDSRAEIDAAAERVGLPAGSRWFAYVGGFNPHKYVDDIVQAHATVAREQGAAAPHLLLVGTVHGDVFHGDQHRIRQAIEAAGTAHLVHWTGFVPDEELRHLLSGACALLLPSASEGFGLPAVEAAACGAPVVATTASPLPELLAGGGYFVEPRDVNGLTNAMRTLATDEPTRRALGARAREQAGRLSWQASAEATMAALREAAA